MKKDLYKVGGANHVNNDLCYYYHCVFSDDLAVISPNALISILKDPKYDEFDMREKINYAFERIGGIVNNVTASILKDGISLCLVGTVGDSSSVVFSTEKINIGNSDKLYKFVNMFIGDVSNYDLGENVKSSNYISVAVMKLELKSRGIEDKFIEGLTDKNVKIKLKGNRYILNSIHYHYPDDMVDYYAFLECIQSSLVRRCYLKCIVNAFRIALTCNEE